MRPIRWRRYKKRDERVAVVEGVRIVWFEDGGFAEDCCLAHGSVTVTTSPTNALQRDAAAYALADLVATLRGLA